MKLLFLFLLKEGFKLRFIQLFHRFINDRQGLFLFDFCLGPIRIGQIAFLPQNGQGITAFCQELADGLRQKVIIERLIQERFIFFIDNVP